MFENYTFPSDKRLAKLPLIAIEGDANDYANWLYEHPEIDRRVPPIYPDFVIRHIQSGHTYEITAHYNDAFTAFCFRLRMDGDNLITGYTDYETINGTIVCVNGGVSAKAADLYTEEWLKQTMLASSLLVIGVQAYMLYFKPETVEQIYAPSESSVPTAYLRRKRITAEPIRIRKSKIKRIYLRKQDRPPKDINYRKLSWFVRGHYRHVGKDKKLKYIQPFTCNRGGKKYRKNSRTYIFTEEKENNNA
jgi:hypothetical protein